MAKTKTIENLFISLDIIASLVPTILIFVYWSTSKREFGLRFLVAYSALILVTELIFMLTRKLSVYQFFTVLEFNLFIAFIYTQIKSLSMRKVIVGSGVFFIIFGSVFPFMWNGRSHTQFDSIQIGVETIIILVFSFYYLYEKMNDTTTLFIYSTFSFWIVVGIVLYLSGSFFTYIFASSLPENDLDRYWIITNIFSILRSIFFCIGVIINSKPQRRLPMSEPDFGILN